MAQNDAIASERNKLILVNVICASLSIALIVLTAYLAIGKQISRIKDLESEQTILLEKRGISPEVNTRIAEAQKLLSDHEQWVAYEKGPKIPNRLNVYGFYQRLSKLADDLQIELQSMASIDSQPELPKGYQGRLIKISASASFDNLHRFLFELGELTEEKVQLHSLQVNLTRDSSVCRVNMVVLLLARTEDKKMASTQIEEQVHGS